MTTSGGARAAMINETIAQTTESVVSSLSTSYGPKGLDKMIVKGKETVVTNDGATILRNYTSNPIHSIMSGLSRSQDSNCGDGTTSVVLLNGALMKRLCELRSKGIHPARICSGIEIAKKIASEYLEKVKVKVGEEEYLNVALTSLNSKIAAKSVKMAHVAVRALEIADKKEIRIVKKISGDIGDIELVEGTVINLSKGYDEARLSGKHKVLLLQLCISAPKTNMDSKIIIDDFSLMQKFVKEESEYVLQQVRAIKESGATLILIQKSLLRESCSELGMHFLKKAGISFINDIERKDIEDIACKLNIKPITDLELMDSPIEVETEAENGIFVIKKHGCSILVSGCDKLVVDEAERSLNDALCVVKGLREEPYIVPGGGSVETGIALALEKYIGSNSTVVHEISKAFLALPYALAHNAGLYAVEIVSLLKKSICENNNLGISLRTNYIADMVNDDSIIQPAAVSRSMVLLALETAQMLIRIDDILPVNQ